MLWWRSFRSDGHRNGRRAWLSTPGQLRGSSACRCALPALHLDSEFPLTSACCLGRDCPTRNLVLLRCCECRMIGLAVCLFLHQGGTTDPSSYQWFVRREHLSQSLEVMVRVQIVGSTGHTTQLQCDCDEPNHGSIWIARRQSGGSEPSRATQIVVATSRPSQHSRGGCYSGGYTRGSRRHSS